MSCVFYSLYTVHQPCPHFGRGLRVGAEVALYNVHLVKKAKVLFAQFTITDSVFLSHVWKVFLMYCVDTFSVWLVCVAVLSVLFVFRGSLPWLPSGRYVIGRSISYASFINYKISLIYGVAIATFKVNMLIIYGCFLSRSHQFSQPFL